MPRGRNRRNDIERRLDDIDQRMAAADRGDPAAFLEHALEDMRWLIEIDDWTYDIAQRYATELDAIKKSRGKPPDEVRLDGYLSRRAAPLSPAALVYRKPNGEYELQVPGAERVALGDNLNDARQAIDALVRAKGASHA
jgi:hypothetical protein